MDIYSRVPCLIHLFSRRITISADKLRVLLTANFNVDMKWWFSAGQLRDGHSINRMGLESQLAIQRDIQDLRKNQSNKLTAPLQSTCSFVPHSIRHTLDDLK